MREILGGYADDTVETAWDDIGMGYAVVVTIPDEEAEPEPNLPLNDPPDRRCPYRPMREMRRSLLFPLALPKPSPSEAIIIRIAPCHTYIGIIIMGNIIA